MIECCKHCTKYCNSYTQTIMPYMEFVTPVFDENNEFLRLDVKIPVELNEPGTGICDNEFSEFYECGVHDEGWCEHFMKKQNKETKHDFSVFDNYKCDGQLLMVFNGNNIDIIEEKQTENKETIQNMYL